MTNDQEPNTIGHAWDGCLLCAVRQLTEGAPNPWNPEIGVRITGVVLKQGKQPSDFGGPYPFLDLWIGGMDRIRVHGYGSVLRHQIEAAEIQIGDTVSIQRGPDETMSKLSRFAGRTYKTFVVEVTRGHHQ